VTLPAKKRLSIYFEQYAPNELLRSGSTIFLGCGGGKFRHYLLCSAVNANHKINSSLAGCMLLGFGLSSPQLDRTRGSGSALDVRSR
jgi:hypothetical protein